MLEGVQHFYQFQEHWSTDRPTAEALKHERYLYPGKAGPHVGEDRRRQLAERIAMSWKLAPVREEKCLAPGITRLGPASMHVGHPVRRTPRPIPAGGCPSQSHCSAHRPRTIASETPNPSRLLAANPREAERTVLIASGPY
jgi:hypothetical protein